MNSELEYDDNFEEKLMNHRFPNCTLGSHNNKELVFCCVNHGCGEGKILNPMCILCQYCDVHKKGKTHVEKPLQVLIKEMKTETK
jgi:hypothetical protein